MTGMDPQTVREKFGDEYRVDARTYMMGIDLRFSTAMAERFRGRVVLETCTGAGLTTIALARAADHVVTVEIDSIHQGQARENVGKAGVEGKVTFVLGDVLNPTVFEGLPRIDSAFLDPDWAVSGPGHVYRFRSSNTRPPADRLLQAVFTKTEDVALVLSPRVDIREFQGLPEHECQCLFLGASHELYCLYFGKLAGPLSRTEFRS